MSSIPHQTADTTAAEAAMDLSTGFDLLMNHLETLCGAIAESPNDLELMEDFHPVLWIVLRLRDGVSDVINKIDALREGGASGG
jgi:hypothetical protein